MKKIRIIKGNSFLDVYSQTLSFSGRQAISIPGYDGTLISWQSSSLQTSLQEWSGTTGPSESTLEIIPTGLTPVSTGDSTPGPFNLYYRKRRLGYLYTELPLTLLGRKIKGIGFDCLTESFNPNYLPIPDYTIKIKSTDITTLTGVSNIEGSTNVFGPVSFTPSFGINVFEFSEQFQWPAIESNLFIDICWSQIPTGWIGQGQHLAVSTSGFDRSYQDDSSGNACSINYSGATNYLPVLYVLI